MNVGEGKKIIGNPYLPPDTEVVIYTSLWIDAILYELEYQHDWWRGQVVKWALKPLEKCIMRVLITEARLHVYEAGPTPQLRFYNSKIPAFVNEDTQRQGSESQLSAGQGIVKR